MHLTTRRVPEDELQEYFDSFTKRFVSDTSPDNADVEVLSPELGAQYEAHDARLVGIVYDRDTAELDVLFETGEHHVFAAREVWVAEEDDGFINAIHVKCADGHQEIIRLRRTPLPAVRASQPKVDAKGTANTRGAP